MVGAVVAAVLMVPSSASAVVEKPEIVRGWASTNSGGLVFSVKVLLGKGKWDSRDVKITYGRFTDDADMVPNLRKIWEGDPFAGPMQNCYTIKVRAKNIRGTVTKRIKVGRLGTQGCPKKS